MRRLAVAEGVFEPGAAKALLGWLTGLATATVGAVGLWLAQRVLGKAAFQTAINDGFAKLTAELQEERDQLKADLTAERQALEAERVAWAAERAAFQGEIRNLQQTIASLKHLLQRHGIDVPEPPSAIPPAPGAIILKGRPE